MEAQVETQLELTIFVEETLSDIRAIQYILNKSSFWQHYNESPVAERLVVANWIKTFNSRALRQWYKKNPHREFLEYSHKEMVEIARKYRIKNYAKLAHYELIREIKQKMEAERHVTA